MLKRIHLTRFRSYDSLDISLNEPVFLILGPNATGKTNILEAIYVSSMGRSFRGEDVEMISHGSDGYSIEAQYDDENIKVTQLIKPYKKKKFERNAVSISRTKLLGRHPVILFEPNDLNLLAGPPEKRRRYLDMILTQTDMDYRRNYLTYRRLLKQRNSLLWRNKKNLISQLEDQLFVLEAQMSPVAEEISLSRKKLIKDLDKIVLEVLRRISNKKHSIVIEFLEKSTDFMNRINSARQRDTALGTTTVGPHREDWRLWFDAHPIQSTASRGENRTTLLSLKLAELEYIRKNTETNEPILLLDDVFSELDESRRRQLVNELSHIQTIITSTDIDKRLKLPAQTLDLTRPS